MFGQERDSYGRWAGKAPSTGVRWSCRSKTVSSLKRSVSRDKVTLLFLVQRERLCYKPKCLLLLFSQSVVFDSLWLHGLQHTRPPCPSPSPKACSNSCPLSWWCHPTISPSVTLFSSCPHSFPASGSFFNELACSYQVAKVLELQLTVSYKRVISTWFSWLVCCPLFLKSNLAEIILMPRR